MNFSAACLSRTQTDTHPPTSTPPQGAALAGIRKWDESARFLKRAMEQSKGDPDNQAMIRSKLQEVVDLKGIEAASGGGVQGE